MSEEHVFETMPLPASGGYPSRIAIIGDLGLTSSSTTSFDHLITNDPSLLLMVGDLTYANQYLTTGGTGASCYSCAFLDSPIRESYQPRWDLWGRFMQPLTSRIPMMMIEGNHEIDPQAANLSFISYKTIFSVRVKSLVRRATSTIRLMLEVYILSCWELMWTTIEQYVWQEKDLKNVNRNTKPWLVASRHAPWYNSYSSHYQEFECMRQHMEVLIYQHGVDIVFSGHVHAYERMNRVYNYTLDPCGPVYITVGDGGNIEKVDVDHADEVGNCPSLVTVCLSLEVFAMRTTHPDQQKESFAGIDNCSGVRIEKAALAMEYLRL